MAGLIQVIALCMSGFGYVLATIGYLVAGRYAMALCMTCYAISCIALLIVGSK